MGKILAPRHETKKNTENLFQIQLTYASFTIIVSSQLVKFEHFQFITSVNSKDQAEHQNLQFSMLSGNQT